MSSDEIVHHLLRTNADVKRAIVGELGEGVLDDDGVIDRKRVGAIVFDDRAKLDFLERLLHPLGHGRVPALARAARSASEPARGLRHRSAAPLRDRRQRALRQGGRDHRPGQAARAAAARHARRPRRAAASGQGEGEARRLRLRQHRHARRARRLGRRGDAGAARREARARSGCSESSLAAFAFYVLETEPRWYERLRYPLEYERDRRRPRRELRPRAAARRSGDLPGVEVRRRRRVVLRRCRPDAAPACRRRRGSPIAPAAPAGTSATSSTPS